MYISTRLPYCLCHVSFRIYSLLSLKVVEKRPNALCLKKVPTFKLFVTLSTLNRFSKFSHSRERTRFATECIQHNPLHLKHAATLPWEIKNSNFLRIFSTYGRICKQSAFSESTHLQNSSVSFFAVYSSKCNLHIKIRSLSLNTMLIADKHCSDIGCDEFPVPQIDRKSNLMKEQ